MHAVHARTHARTHTRTHCHTNTHMHTQTYTCTHAPVQEKRESTQFVNDDERTEHPAHGLIVSVSRRGGVVACLCVHTCLIGNILSLHSRTCSMPPFQAHCYVSCASASASANACVSAHAPCVISLAFSPLASTRHLRPPSLPPFLPPSLSSTGDV